MTSNNPEPASPSRGGGLVRLRLDIAYDGTAFCGWARQVNQRSVQEDIETALVTVLRLDAPARLVVAGRTDAGVHASGQVAHVDVPRPVDGYRLQRALNGLLAADVRIRGIRAAPDGFEARFSALSRRYAYRLADGPTGAPPLRRIDTAWHDRSLDVDAMNAAGERLLGLHNFAAFCRRRDGATTIRALQELHCVREDDVISARVVADAFCHSMVRSLMGALIAVGDGRKTIGWAEGLLKSPARASDVVVAPARGLTLIEVVYPPDGDLAARAATTRIARSLPV